VKSKEYEFSEDQIFFRDLFKKSLWLTTKYLCGFHEGNVKETGLEYCMKGYLHGNFLNMVQYKEWRNLFITMPRGYFKSSMMTIGLPIWLIINNPNIRIGIGCANVNIGSKYFSHQKKIIRHTPLFHALFPDIIPIYSPNSPEGLWSRTNYTVNRDMHFDEPTALLFSPGSDVEGYHFDIMILDDLVNRKNSSSPTLRERIKEFIDDTINLKDSSKTPTIVIGNFWNVDDAYAGKVVKDPTYAKIVYPLYDEEGNVTFPEKFTPEYINRIRRSMSDKMYTTQYLLKPVSEGNAPLSKYPFVKYFEEKKKENDREIIVRVTEDGKEIKSKIIGTMVAMDTAGEGKDTAGVVVLQRDDDDDFFLRYAKERKHFPRSERLEEFRNLNKWFNVNKLGIEIFGQIKAKDLLPEKAEKDTDVGYKIVELKHRSRAKDERIMWYLEPMLALNKFYVFDGVPESAIKEIQYYREMAQDTIPDALSYAREMFDIYNVSPHRGDVHTTGGYQPRNRGLFGSNL